MIMRAVFPPAYSRRAVLLGLTALTFTSPLTAGAAAPPNQADRNFLAWDIQIEIQQQDMGRLAERRGQTEEVRALGTYLVNRHRDSQQRLQQVVSQLEVTLSVELSPTHLRVQKHFASISDAVFDKAFIRHEIADYRYFLNHFEASAHTQNKPLRDYCISEIPLLKEDQARITALMQALGGSGEE